MKPAFLFSGQGSQSVGMGSDLYQNFPAARDVFAEVDETLHRNLSTLMFQGDPDMLTQTQNAQPAIMAVGMAVVRAVESEWGHPLTDVALCMAGHSLGEYTALCAAGALTLADTARLLDIRGQAMAAAAQTVRGGMTAIIGLDIEKVQEIANQASTPAAQVVVANDNCVGQVILSGHRTALDTAAALAQTAGAKRVLPLAVSGPFHSPYMQPAAQVVAAALADVPVRSPRVPVIANRTAQPETDPDDIRRTLTEQVCGTVRWTETAQTMAALGTDTFVECAVGKVMTGLMKRLCPTIPTLSAGDSTGVRQVLNMLTGTPQ